MVTLWLLIFACIVVLFIKIGKMNEIFRRLETLEKRVQFLSDNVFDGFSYSRSTPDKETESPEAPPVTEEQKSEEVHAEQEPGAKTEAPPAEELHPPLPPVQPVYQASNLNYDDAEPSEEPQHETRQAAIRENELVKRWRQFRENVDWEQFTGANLFAWIGGIALFIGAGFFVKYSIDRNLIPPTVRLVTGAITGLILIIASGRFERGKYDIMRHTLAAGGIGVLYSIIFAATLYYHYISNYAGFGFLIIISAAAFVLAIYHKGIAVSVLGAIGAYATPILVSTGGANLYLLFLYLAIVNIGLYQVTRRLKSPLLMLVATDGTIASLAIGTLFATPEPAGMTIAITWIANMSLFSLFFERLKPGDAESRCLLWSGITLYLAILVIALITMIRYHGSAPMLIFAAAMSGAIILARNNRRWYSCVIPYSVLTFIAAILWSLFRFDPHGTGWSFLLYLIYGIAGGLGPVLLIMKYGPDRQFISWFRTFPVAVAGLSLSAIIRDPAVSFWFWPMTLGLQALGIFITIIFGGLIQIGIFALLFVISGVIWIMNIPSYFIGYGFYSFTFIAGVILCVLVFVLIKKLPVWRRMFKIGPDTSGSSIDLKKPAMEWMTSTPAMGIFLLIAASFISREPINPHPGMTTILCFLALMLTIARRLDSEPPAMVALLSSVFAQAIWILNPVNGPELYLYALCWSGAFFVCSVIIPFFIFSSMEKWKRLWTIWAIFEVFQGLFVIVAANHLLDRALSGWVPLALAFIKLPAIIRLIKGLEGRSERNLILAFHGGILLFYVSTIPVMLLDHGWIGLALVFEAALLLWLNRRIEHPGLRWVSIFMAPAGLIVLLFSLDQMNAPDSLKILNPAVLSVAACAASLAWAVRLGKYPESVLKKIEIDKYFLWLAAGTGFLLLNLIVADIFSAREILYTGKTLGTMHNPGHNLMLFRSSNPVMAVSHTFIWMGYGLCMLLWKKVFNRPFRVAGIVLVILGILKSLAIPFMFRMEFNDMLPVLNLPMLLYLSSVIMLIYLTVKKDKSCWPFTSINPGPFWGVTLAITTFCIMNIEIAAAFGIKGRPFSLMTYGSLSHQLGYSLGWLLYSIGMLITGIRRDFVRVRWASLILIVITALKVFFKDLWSLGQLYRVASFIGLALVLILVSYLYQRFLSGRRKDA